MQSYEPIRSYWDKIFAKTPHSDPAAPVPVAEIEAGLAWVSGPGGSILDFGCGHGRLLLRCLALGAEQVTGIDLSGKAVEAAQMAAAQVPSWTQRVDFRQGGVEMLAVLSTGSYRGAILSNILDNLVPGDAGQVLDETGRLLIPGGRLLVRLNPHFDRSDFPASQGYVELEPDLYREPSGLLFWNLTDRSFEQLIGEYFQIFQRVELSQPPGRIYYLKL
jgi:arsenite methyltransferase